jgi:2-methylfumaryl-CoA hydratase
LAFDRFDTVATGGRFFWEDYEPGERINHPQGTTVEDAEHQMATRLYQNNARVHFNEQLQKKSRLGTRIVYGGHVISVCHGICHDGFENVIRILGFNAGAHANPTVAGDTSSPGRTCSSASTRPPGLRRPPPALVGGQEPRPQRRAHRPEGEGPETGRESHHPNVVLDLDYTVLIREGRLGGHMSGDTDAVTLPELTELFRALGAQNRRAGRDRKGGH